MHSILIWSLASATNRSGFAFTPPMFWLLLGVVLSAIDLLIITTQPQRYRYYLLMMGVAALISSFILWRGSVTFQFSWANVMYEDFDWQISYWMGIALALSIWIRPIFIFRKKFVIPESTAATTISEILSGETGMVIYEGASWKARNEDSQLIASRQKVYVLRREGNTLIVIPDRLIHNS
ncbi:NfeD family protein [Microcoleus sp. bin38.metabat.b11b12b14.051]|uniref:NfeD family protein n=1 Tax=Microcoleus sp. bin38.metabat.b11b12b14.051 TaxID=2742709 RepID=UPI0025D46608|nr:NfeD family protein [Microcoleus sp. bin38.metabat.b11b12b14.051]